MKKIAYLSILIIFLWTSCSKSTCPTFDKNNDGGTSGGKGKSKSSLYPKKM